VDLRRDVMRWTRHELQFENDMKNAGSHFVERTFGVSEKSGSLDEKVVWSLPSWRFSGKALGHLTTLRIS